MADNKTGRDKQADDEENRQRERDVLTELERGDETEPPVDERELEALETELESLEFPATGAGVVASIGEHEVVSADGTYAIGDLVPETDEETFDAPTAVRARVQRPRIAAAMKRLVEASETLQNENLRGSQRDAYEKTFRKLQAIDADDDDEGIQEISDWIVARIHDDETLPGSRDVRREAAKFCRANGYQVRSDEWLGI